MTRLGKWLGLITALCGFATAHVLVQGGSAMQLPVPTSSVTVPPVPAPTLPVPPPPTLTTPTVPVPPPPTPTVSVPPAPVPAPPAPKPPVPVPPAPKPPAPTPVPAPPVLPAPPAAPGVPSVSTSQPSTPSATPPSALPGTAAQPSGRSQAPGEPAPPVALSGAPPAPSSTPVPAARGTSSGGVAQRATTQPRTLEARRLKRGNRISVRLRFRLPKADRVFLIVRGPAPSCRIVGYIPVRGRKGVNDVAFVGRVNGRRLEPGTYLISLSTSRRLVPDAATEYVRVVSPRRSLPLPDSAPKPSCTDSTVLVTATTAQLVLPESLPAIATPTVRPAQPTRPGRATPAPSRAEDDAEASGFIPDAGVLGVATDAAADEPFVAIAVLSIIAALLIAMVALVTRFLRGSWNP